METFFDENDDDDVDDDDDDDDDVRWRVCWRILRHSKSNEP